MNLDPADVASAPLVAVTEPHRKTLAMAVVGSLEIGRDCGGLLLAEHRPSLRRPRSSRSGNTAQRNNIESTLIAEFHMVADAPLLRFDRLKTSASLKVYRDDHPHGREQEVLGHNA